MDGQRFDDLTRVLGAATSRRRLLRGLGVALGGLLGGRVVQDAAAACTPGQVTRRGGCVCRTTGRPPVEAASCRAGKLACRGCCVDACRGDQVLDPDRCTCTCPAGLSECGRQCVDPALYQSDPSNCGGCRIVCSSGETCQGGVCTAPTCLSLGALCANSAQCCQDEPTVCVNSEFQGANRCVHIDGGTCSDSQDCGTFFGCNGGRCACEAISTDVELAPCGGLYCFGAQCLDYANAICGRNPDTGDCPGTIFTLCGDACCPPGSTCLNAATSTCSIGCTGFCLP